MANLTTCDFMFHDTPENSPIDGKGREADRNSVDVVKAVANAG